MNEVNPTDASKPQEISIADLFRKFKSLLSYLKSKWLLIAAFTLLGAVAGITYALLKKPTFTATCTFVLEDSGHGGPSQYSGLASLIGISLPNGSSGIFQGDNILELYRSRAMIEKALLSTGNFDGKEQLLIDRFIDKNDLRSEEKDDHKIGKVNFAGDPKNFNRQQDSIIIRLVDLINRKVLIVSRPDKRLSIISVEVVSNDELFSKYFDDRIVKTVNDFYVQTKTKNSLRNVQTLQHQADSLRTRLNASLYGVASAIESDPNANPQLATLRVPSQKRQVDVQASTAIYSEIIKNLELAKVSLREEVPLIQVIDTPVFPLRVNTVNMLKTALLGGILLGALITAYLAAAKILRTLLAT